MEQPAYVLEVLDLCGATYRAIESEAHKKHEREMRKTQNASSNKLKVRG